MLQAINLVGVAADSAAIANNEVLQTLRESSASHGEFRVPNCRWGQNLRHGHFLNVNRRSWTTTNSP
jgi:hypothetical protein